MKKVWSILLIIGILTIGCSSKRELNGFFAWMDGYLAMAVGEEVEVGLTFFYQQNKVPFTADDFLTLSFDDIDQIEISDYSITPLDEERPQGYRGYVFDLTIKAEEKGVFRTDKLVANINNESVVFPIGDWIFDIEEGISPSDEEGIIDIWGSPGAWSNPEVFIYDYKVTDKNTTLKEIWLSEDTILSEAMGLPLVNDVELPRGMSAPIKFIRPKLILTVNGEEVITFGMSSYVGAINNQKDMVEKSKIRNKIGLS